MEKIIKIYEHNEKDLMDHNKNLLDKCHSVIEDCTKIFSMTNLNDTHLIDSYIVKLKKCVSDNMERTKLNDEYKYIIRKVNLHIQLLEYLKIVNYNDEVVFDSDKYNIVVDAYNIFVSLKEDISKSYVEWCSNNYVFFYSQSTNYTNICVYYLDDLFGYKIFLTFKKNNLTNKIKICIFDVIIKCEKDFYNRIDNYKLQFINIKQILNCFSMDSDDITKEYQESNYINSQKMLQYVSIFLDN